MKKILIATFSLGLVISLSSMAAASIIAEVEPNNPLGSAQIIDLDFSTDYNVDIQDSTGTPWVSILGTGNGTYDYYSFTVDAGATAWFDIDYGSGGSGTMDTEIALWDSSGIMLGGNDDTWVADSGSSSGYDSWMEYTFTTTGMYYIGVAEYWAAGTTGGWSAWSDFPDSGDTYTLQVSVSGHSTDAPAPVPEPATMLLFGTGLTGLAALGRRRKKS